MKAILKINDKEIEVEMHENLFKELTKKKKSPFERSKQFEGYFYITAQSTIAEAVDFYCEFDDIRHSVANFCTDRDLLQQQAYREILNRLLWRWQFENDEPVDWDSLNKNKYFIVFDNEEHNFTFDLCDIFNNGGVYFSTEEKAEQAIEEVINPFMKEHPDFVW